MHQPTGVSMAPLPVAQQTNKQSAPRRDSDKLRLLAVFMFVLSVASIWGLLQRSSCLQQQPHQLSLAAGGRLADSKVPLVFAAVNGLDPADASVFVRSAFKYLDTRTRIVLATDSSNPANAYLYGLQRRYDRIRVLNSSMADISVPCGDEDMPLSVYLSRFVVLRDFLAEEGGRYSVVIACDARDTAFQADVFARPLVQAAAHVPMVVAGVEDIPRGAGFGDATISLAEEKNWNQRWLNTCFGASSYNNTQRRAIVCSGFLVGHVVAMEELSRTIVQVFQDTCCRAEQRGLDQGILNWLVHFAPPSAKRGLRLELAQNGDVVFSMSNTAYLNEMTYNEGNLIVNAYTKQPFPVIHQFDRVHEYIPVIKSLYPPLGGQWCSLKGPGLSLLPGGGKVDHSVHQACRSVQWLQGLNLGSITWTCMPWTTSNISLDAPAVHGAHLNDSATVEVPGGTTRAKPSTLSTCHVTAPQTSSSWLVQACGRSLGCPWVWQQHGCCPAWLGCSRQARPLLHGGPWLQHQHSGGHVVLRRPVAAPDSLPG